MISRTASESTRSARAVEPTTSQKSRVATLRRSGRGATSAAPQPEQKRASLAFCLRHAGQAATPKRYARRSLGISNVGPGSPLTPSGPCACIAAVLRTLVILAAIALAIGARFAFG